MAKKSRTKQFVQGQMNAVDSAASMLANLGKATSSLATSSPGLIGKIKGAKQGAKYVREAIGDAGKAMYESAKSIFNNKGIYEQNGKVTPAANTNRPMNPTMIKQITKDPTLGSVIKVVDLYASWTGFNNSIAFDQVVFEYFQAIRSTLRSNLPYTQNFLKAYLINAINLHAIAMTVKKLLQFRSISMPDLPKGYELFRSVAKSFEGYGLADLDDIEWLNEENISQSISIYDLIADIHNRIMLLPKRMSDWIDHYFGLVYRMDKDDYNPQYINPLLVRFEVASYDNTTDTVTTDTLEFTNITPQVVLNYLTDFAQQYGMITADITKSQNGLYSITLPKFSQLTNETYYDPTYIQAIINAYTSDSALVDNKYLRMDLFTENGKPLGDDLTTYLFLGAISNKRNNSTDNMYIPLIQVHGMCAKLMNDPELIWDRGFSQGDEDFSKYNKLGLSIQTDVIADYYINASDQTTFKPLEYYFDKVYNGEATITGFRAMGSLSKIDSDFGRGHLINQDNIELRIGQKQEGYAYVPLVWFKITQGANVKRYFACIEYKYFNGQDAPLSKLLNFQSTGKYVVLDDTKIVAGINQNWNGYNMFKTAQTGVANFTFAGPTINNLLGLVLVNVQSMSEFNGPYKYTKDTFGYILNTDGGQTIFTGSDINLDSGETYAFNTNVNTIFSLTTVSGITTGAQADIAVNSGYLGLVAYFVDQVDHHLPVLHKVRSNVKFSSEDSYRTTNILTDLIKESYIPYFYQVDDLLPVSYQMITSLLKPSNTLSTRDKSRN